MNTRPLSPCPFCGAALTVREHSAFHPGNDCWIAHERQWELIEEDYPAWNRRAGGTVLREANDALSNAALDLGDMARESDELLGKIASLAIVYLKTRVREHYITEEACAALAQESSHG